MQSMAQAWLVLQMTGSPFWLGFDSFMATAPGLVLTLVGGLFADVISKKRLLIWTQTGAAICAVLLALFVLTGTARLWLILTLSFLSGSCIALAWPAYHAITTDLVQREDLPNAIALNSTQKQLSRLIGPVLAGFIIKAFGLGGCFLVNAFSYVAVVGALALIHYDEPTTAVAHKPPARTAQALWRDLLSGFYYVYGRPRVWTLLLICAMVSFFGAPYLFMIPLFAQNVYGMGETGVALMLGAAAAGALSGALLLAFLGDFKGKGLFVLGSVFVFALSLIGFALATQIHHSLVLLFGSGFTMVTYSATINVLIQRLTDDRTRGRVMGMLVLAFSGPAPLGCLVTGIIAQTLGAPFALKFNGLIICAFILTSAIRKKFLRELD